MVARRSRVTQTGQLYFAIEDRSANPSLSHPPRRSVRADSSNIASLLRPIAFPRSLQRSGCADSSLSFSYGRSAGGGFPRHIAAQSQRLHDGREVGALRRVERMSTGIRKPIELLLSRASLEPGIFGIARPC